jgi:phage tail sheath protein FI
LFNTPAGRTRGRILGVVSMQQTLSDTDSEYLISGKVNPIMIYPGEGTFLMGNVTSYSGSGGLGHINTAMTVSYLRSRLLDIAQALLFELNTPNTRERFTNSATTLLQTIKTGNGISDFRVICDETNNTETTIAENKLLADVFIRPTFSAETVLINIINTNTSQIL